MFEQRPWSLEVIAHNNLMHRGEELEDVATRDAHANMHYTYTCMYVHVLGGIDYACRNSGLAV